MVITGLAHSALLKGSSFRDCFLSFPHHWRAFIHPASVTTFLVESSTHSILVSWAGRMHDQEEGDEEDIVYLSLKFMKLNGFHECDMVVIKQVPCPTSCINVTMVLNSISEWEEILLNIDVAQDAFLSQVRVLKLDQFIPLWLEGGAVVYMKVKTILPDINKGLLQFNSLVEILPPLEGDLVPRVSLNPTAKPVQDTDIKQKSRINSVQDLLNLLNYIFPIINLKRMPLPELNDLSISLKVVNFLLLSEKENILYKLIQYHPSLVIIGNHHLKQYKLCEKKYFISTCIVEKKINGMSTKETILENSSTEDIFAVVLVWDAIKKFFLSNIRDQIIIDSLDKVLRHKSCIMSFPLQRLLAITTDSIILIKALSQPKMNDMMEVDISHLTSVKDTDRIISSVKSQFSEICDLCPIIINNMTVINTEMGKNYFDMLLSIRNKKPLYIDKLSILMFSINVISKPPNFVPQVCLSKDECDINVQRNYPLDTVVIKNLTYHLFLDLNLTENDLPLVTPHFVLLQGGSGSGKTYIVEHLSNVLSKSPNFIHCEIIRMKSLKGKKVESIHKVLKTAIKDAIDFQPSVIFIDDLDFICPNSENDQERGALNDYLTHITYMIKNMLHLIIDKCQVDLSGVKKEFLTVVATCISRDSVNLHLSSPKGKHTFPKSFQINPINSEQKYELLKSVIMNYYESFLKMNNFHKCEKGYSVFNFDKNISKGKLEGLSLTDISNLARRIFLEGQSRWTAKFASLRSSLHFQIGIASKVAKKLQCPEVCNFTDEDFSRAYLGFVPLATKALKLPMKAPAKKEVGGLAMAKEALEEMILWPSQFPALFKQTTLSLRSGILLYGPPGCGKTILANTFANHPHINFITIKGPELLSKYIGQSEKSVREVFQRAQNAKPCVLFFDEFESIAPRRGHDSTGVTDRVVNQLLTQMDGVEGLIDVYVLAATSRPDLIDPALLRPGRLDKAIYCPIPNEMERLVILKAISKELSFGEEIDFVDIALKTHDFTGADLQSLLSTVQVKAAQEAIGNTLYKDIFVNEPCGAFKERQESTDSEGFVQILSDLSLEKLSLENEKSLNFNNDDKKAQLIDSTLNNNCSNVTLNAKVVVMKKHFEIALVEVKPSISAIEKLKYDALHQMFNNSQENRVFEHVLPGKRETLA